MTERELIQVVKFILKWTLIGCGVVAVFAVIGLSQGDLKVAKEQPAPAQQEAARQPLTPNQLTKLWRNMRLYAELYCTSAEEAERFKGGPVIDQANPAEFDSLYTAARQQYNQARPFTAVSLPRTAPHLEVAVDRYC